MVVTLPKTDKQQSQSHTVNRANKHTHRHTDSRRIRKQNNSNHRYNGKHDPCMVVVVVGLLVSIVYYLTDTQSQSHTVDRANIHTHSHTDSSRRIRKQNNSNHRNKATWWWWWLGMHVCTMSTWMGFLSPCPACLNDCLPCPPVGLHTCAGPQTVSPFTVTHHTRHEDSQ